MLWYIPIEWENEQMASWKSNKIGGEAESLLIANVYVSLIAKCAEGPVTRLLSFHYNVLVAQLGWVDDIEICKVMEKQVQEFIFRTKRNPLQSILGLISIIWFIFFGVS